MFPHDDWEQLDIETGKPAKAAAPVPAIKRIRWVSNHKHMFLVDNRRLYIMSTQGASSEQSFAGAMPLSCQQYISASMAAAPATVGTHQHHEHHLQGEMFADNWQEEQP